MNKYFSRDVPSVQELVQNMSLVLSNSHFSLNQPRPFVPNFIEIGGMHIDKNTTLSKVLI